MPQAPSLILSQREIGFAFLHRARSRAAPLDSRKDIRLPSSDVHPELRPVLGQWAFHSGRT